MPKEDNLLALPDEILLMICKELKMVDVLCFVADVNQRLNRIAHDSLFIRRLDLTGLMTIKYRSKDVLTDEQISSHLSEKIFPRIHDQIHQLIVEPYLMNEILATANYPQLFSLSLRNFEYEVLYHYFTDNVNLRLLCKQMTHLDIDVRVARFMDKSMIISKMFALILSLCDQLIELNFPEYICETMGFGSEFNFLKINFLSTTLTKLKITVACYYDCLYLLDGRLDSLSILIVNVGQIFDPVLDIGGKKKLPKLKSFSFTSLSFTEHFDTLIVPLIRRMINLEQLKLYLMAIYRRSAGHLDGVQLSDLFLNHLTQLRRFTFNIHTDTDQIASDHPFLTNEVIERSFKGKHYQQVVAAVFNGFCGEGSACSIYSLPYDFDYFHCLNNSFTGGHFRKVRFLTMEDESPFEDSLFQLISRDMPYLERLTITNEHPQNNKQCSSTSLIFPHLEYLDLRRAHDDYVESFLWKNTSLPRLSTLRHRNESLETPASHVNSDSTHVDTSFVL